MFGVNVCVKDSQACTTVKLEGVELWVVTLNSHLLRVTIYRWLGLPLLCTVGLSPKQSWPSQDQCSVLNWKNFAKGVRNGHHEGNHSYEGESKPVFIWKTTSMRLHSTLPLLNRI